MKHAARLGWLAATALLLDTGCQRTPGNEHAASTGPADHNVNVGPVPGPAIEDVKARGPYYANADAEREGRTLFVRFNCSGCHGGRAGGGMGPSLRDQDWIYGNNDVQIFDSIASGRANGMPAWGTRITADQTWKIVSYIDALRTPSEPDAPQ
jgi:cytochrome c oxidase cbb3-type subunit 3